MAKRRAPLPDFHLWHQVAETVAPLRLPRRRLLAPAEAPLPLPAATPPPRTKPKTPVIPMPAYRPAGLPGRSPGTGIEPNLRKRLQRGTTQIDAVLDLHGMRQAEAHAALSRFVQARVARGDRTILVITGKGLKKLERDAATIVEAGVLRSMLPVWLSDPKLAPMIAGWDVAAQPHGGEGAWYVRLRRAPVAAR
jgi:DNA-nicking Smr family endonuclease